jgi:hypothetical protein
MEYIEDDGSLKGTRRMALMRCDIEHLPRSQEVRDAGDRKFKGPGEQQGPLLVRMGVLGDDGARSDVNSALRNLV